MASILYIFIAISVLFSSIDSLSTCDETDIVFLIDTDSIRHSGDTIIQFITSIIWSGSSEHSALSVVLYGNDMPRHQQTHLITLHETHVVHQRHKIELKTIDTLETAFNTIDSFNHIDDPKKSVPLLTAFKTALNQNQPKHAHKARRNLNYIDLEQPPKYKAKQAYFVFDYGNKLIKTHNDALCAVFNDIKNNDDISVHVLLGQTFQNPKIKCRKDIPSHNLQIKHHMFYHFNKHNLLNKHNINSLIEMIYDITCPSKMLFPEFGGSVGLGNHNQFIDLKTVLKCHLVFVDKEDVKEPSELDSQKSYILVRDYAKDDNTFQTNDYLIADPKTYKEFKDNGCSPSAIYKIVKIQHITDLSDHKILKLQVSLPTSFFDYILSADVRGKNIPFNKKRKAKPPKKRKLIQITAHSRAVNIVAAGGLKKPELHFEKHWEWDSDAKGGISFETQFPGVIAPAITISGGKIKLKYGFLFDLITELDFDFAWSMFTSFFSPEEEAKDILKFIVHGKWHLNYYFDAVLSGHLKVTIEKLLNFEKQFMFFIGPVPIAIKPFAKLNIVLETLPIEVHGRYDCDYAQSFKLGYDYAAIVTQKPQFSAIRAESKVDATPVRSWTGKQTDKDCAQTVFLYSATNSWHQTDCHFFDWNSRTKLCRCMDKERNLLKIHEGRQTTVDEDTTVYLMDHKCKKWVKRCSSCEYFDGSLSKDEFFIGHYFNDPTQRAKEKSKQYTDDFTKKCTGEELQSCAICDIAPLKQHKKVLKEKKILERRELRSWKGKRTNFCQKDFAITNPTQTIPASSVADQESIHYTRTELEALSKADIIEVAIKLQDGQKPIDPIQSAKISKLKALSADTFVSPALTASLEKHDSETAKSLKPLMSHCPADQEIGWDASLEFYLGVDLYFVIEVYLLAKFSVPFRIHLPEKNGRFLVDSKHKDLIDDMCAEANLKIAFLMECKFELFAGFKFVVPDLPLQLINKLRSGMDKLHADVKKGLVVGPATITVDETEIEQEKAGITKYFKELHEELTTPHQIGTTKWLMRKRAIGWMDIPAKLNTELKKVCCPIVTGQKFKVKDITDGRKVEEVSDLKWVELNFDGILEYFKNKGEKEPIEEINLVSKAYKSCEKQTFSIKKEIHYGFVVTLEEHRIAKKSGEMLPVKVKKDVKLAFVSAEVNKATVIQEWIQKIKGITDVAKEESKSGLKDESKSVKRKGKVKASPKRKSSSDAQIRRITHGIHSFD